MFVVHFIGAMLAFGVGMVYTWTQSVLSYITCPGLSSFVVFILRVMISVTATITFILSILPV